MKTFNRIFLSISFLFLLTVTAFAQNTTIIDDNLIINGSPTFVPDLIFKADATNRGASIQFSSGSTTRWLVGYAPDNTNDLRFLRSTGSSGLQTVLGLDYSTGNVGIGANTPIAPLDVRGDNLILLRPGVGIDNLSSNRFVALGESGGVRGAINGCDIYGFRSQLSTSNFINVGVTSSNAPTISWETTNSSDRLDLRVDNSSSSCGTLVAQFGTGTYKLIVKGKALADGGSWVASDRRFKTNIKKIGNALSLVRQIEGDTYEYNQDNEAGRTMPEGKSLGFVAQELAKVLPDAVIKDEEGFYAVNYDAVIPVLVEAVKELDGQMEVNTNLQQQVAELRSELNELKGIKSPAGASFGKAELFQNTPNPFNVDTRIGYTLPEGAQEAALYVYDMQGVQVAVYKNLNAGNGEVMISGSRLKAGMYLYTLIADGKEVDTKRMIMTR